MTNMDIQRIPLLLSVCGTLLLTVVSGQNNYRYHDSRYQRLPANSQPQPVRQATGDATRHVDYQQIRRLVRTELDDFRREQVNSGQHQHFQAMSRDLQELGRKVDQLMLRQNPNRDVGQQLERRFDSWITSLEQRFFNEKRSCEGIERSIAELKSKLEYIQQMMSQFSQSGGSLGSSSSLHSRLQDPYRYNSLRNSQSRVTIDGPGYNSVLDSSRETVSGPSKDKTNAATDGIQVGDKASDYKFRWEAGASRATPQPTTSSTPYWYRRTVATAAPRPNQYRQVVYDRQNSGDPYNSRTTYNRNDYARTGYNYNANSQSNTNIRSDHNRYGNQVDYNQVDPRQVDPRQVDPRGSQISSQTGSRHVEIKLPRPSNYSFRYPKVIGARDGEDQRQRLPETTARPTVRPMLRPTVRPTQRPTQRPTPQPVQYNTQRPVQHYTHHPRQHYTQQPVQHYTQHPRQHHTQRPVQVYTQRPVQVYTQSPTYRPTPAPVRQTWYPTQRPTARPTERPSKYVRYSNTNSNSAVYNNYQRQVQNQGYPARNPGYQAPITPRPEYDYRNPVTSPPRKESSYVFRYTQFGQGTAKPQTDQYHRGQYDDTVATTVTPRTAQWYNNWMRHKHQSSRSRESGESHGRQETEQQTAHHVLADETANFDPSAKYGQCPLYIRGLGTSELERKSLYSLVGTWLSDAGAQDQRIWSVEGGNALHWNSLVEYEDIEAFETLIGQTQHTLPEFCTGLGPVIFKGHLYCQSYVQNDRGEISLLKIDLATNEVVARGRLTGQDGRNLGVSGKGWAGIYLQLELMVDETGMWALTGESETRRLVLFKLDPTDLKVLSMTRLARHKDTVGPTFMTCGVLYAFDSHYATQLTYTYDTAQQREKNMDKSTEFSFPALEVISLQYNPVDRKLYMWKVTKKSKKNPFKKHRNSRKRMYGIGERLSPYTTPNNYLF